MPDDERILKHGEILNRKYKIEKFLGGGAFGEVYRVKNQWLKKRFAVKVFKVSLDLKGNESSIQDLLDEAVILAKFDHRNIVKVHDADTFKTKEGHEYVFFVMDYIPAGDLKNYMDTFMSYVPLDEAVDIAKQICVGLNVLHSENPPMIHRDIKPQNIMIGYDDHGLVAKLTDFGLVKTVNPSTLYASAKGTLAYKAPEYLEEIDNTSTDIFAVGVTFYELLTKELPYPIHGELDVMTGSWLKQTPKPIHYYNPLIKDKKLEEIVSKAISTNPDERYQNAQELLDAIEEWEENREVVVDADTSEINGGSDDSEINDEAANNSIGESKKIQKDDKINLQNESNLRSIIKNSGNTKKVLDNNDEDNESNKDDKDPYNFIDPDDMMNSDTFDKMFNKDKENKKKPPEPKKKNNGEKKDTKVVKQENQEELNYSKPADALIKDAKRVVNNNLNYNKGIEFLEQAITQKPELKDEYESVIKLWKSFKLIEDDETIDEGIDSLKQLIMDDSNIKEKYEFTINILSDKNPKKLEQEALKYIESNDFEKASISIELAMLMDEDIKKQYRYKLKNLKKGVMN